jgi:hypothetical protein
MKIVAEYRDNARHCRELAAAMESPKHKKMLERMAKAWDALADERERSLFKEPD